MYDRMHSFVGKNNIREVHISIEIVHSQYTSIISPYWITLLTYKSEFILYVVRHSYVYGEIWGHDLLFNGGFEISKDG